MCLRESVIESSGDFIEAFQYCSPFAPSVKHETSRRAKPCPANRPTMRAGFIDGPPTACEKNLKKVVQED
jgi:hypothetical protein